MSRGNGAGKFVFHPAKPFAIANYEKIQGVGEARWLFVAWAGVKRGGFEFPAFEIRRGFGGDFEFGDCVVELPAVEAMHRLHGKMRPMFRTAGDSDAITAFGAFKLIGPAHAEL